MNAQLDAYIGAYGEGFVHAFDNDIMLNWYPERIIAKTSPGQSLLELGIGHGFTTSRFARHFGRHVVVEGSRSVIAQFTASHSDCSAEIIEAYFETFETTERFDTVVMGFVLEHVDDPRIILERFNAFLAPHGRCFVAVPNGESLHRRLGKEAGLLDDMMALGPGDLQLGHVRMYSVDRLRNEIEAAGYRLVGLEGVFLKPFTTAQLQALNLPASVLRALCAVGVDYPELSCALLAEIEAVG